MFQTGMEKVLDHTTIWSQKIFCFSEHICDEESQADRQTGKKLCQSS